MTNNLIGYVVLWRIYERNRYMLWIDGASERDWFVKIPGTSELLIRKTRSGLTNTAIKYNITISKETAHEINMDLVLYFLGALRSNRFLSHRAAETLLAAWNGLDDIAYSIGDSIFEQNSLARHNKKIYEKLFHANNLPSVTPIGEHYKTILSDEERKHLRSLLRNKGLLLLKNAKILCYGD